MLSPKLTQLIKNSITDEEAANELIALLETSPAASVTITSSSTDALTPYILTQPTGTYENIPGFSVDLTIAIASTIYAAFNYTVDSPSGGSCEADVRLTINSSPVENSAGMHIVLSNNNDARTGAGRMLTDTLPPGTYTVQAQFRKTTGNGSLRFILGTVFAQAQTF